MTITLNTIEDIYANPSMIQLYKKRFYKFMSHYKKYYMNYFIKIEWYLKIYTILYILLNILGYVFRAHIY